MIRILSNAAGTKRMIVNGASATMRDQNVLSVHSGSEIETLITKHHLVDLPITHRNMILNISANDQQLSVRVTLFELEKSLPGVWFRSEVARTSGDRRTLPCYFTFVPVRKRRGVYDYQPVINMIHLDGSELSMFPQVYDTWEPIKESALKAADYTTLGITGHSSRKRA